MDSEFDDDGYLVLRFYCCGMRGWKFWCVDDDLESNVFIWGRVGMNDSFWGDLKFFIVGYFDLDKLVGDEFFIKVYINCRFLFVSLDFCEEGWFLYYDVLFEDV